MRRESSYTYRGDFVRVGLTVKRDVVFLLEIKDKDRTRTEEQRERLKIIEKGLSCYPKPRGFNFLRPVHQYVGYYSWMLSHT